MPSLVRSPRQESKQPPARPAAVPPGRGSAEPEEGGFKPSYDALCVPMLLKRNKALEREVRKLRKELGLPKHAGDPPGESPFAVRRRAKLLETQVADLEAERGAYLCRALVAEEQVETLQAELKAVVEDSEKRLAAAFGDMQVGSAMSREQRTSLILRRGKDDAALRIQSRVRGNQTRKMRQRVKIHLAVTRIQAVFRGNAKREDVAVLKAQKNMQSHLTHRASLQKQEMEKAAALVKQATGSALPENSSDSDDTDDSDF